MSSRIPRISRMGAGEQRLRDEALKDYRLPSTHHTKQTSGMKASRGVPPDLHQAGRCSLIVLIPRHGMEPQAVPWNSETLGAFAEIASTVHAFRLPVARGGRVKRLRQVAVQPRGSLEEER